jgi:hypothetical protein
MGVAEAHEQEEPNQQLAVELFCSYSHADEGLWKELEKHLEVLRRQGMIQIWSDRKIGAGADWSGDIDSHLESAQIVLLLISADFLASDYCMDIEVARAIARHNRGEACLVPIILRPVDWLGHPLSRYQALPTHAKPVTQWPDRDEAFRTIAVELRRIIEDFLKSKATRRTGSAPPDIALSYGRFAPGVRRRDTRWYWVASIVFLVAVCGTTGAWLAARWRRQPPPAAPKLSALPTHINRIDGLNYVRLHSGVFTRGCLPRQPECKADARPARLIRISYPFWIGQTLVTNEAYRGFLKAASLPLKRVTNDEQFRDDPVVNITWQEANNYCQWAGGRLPFESEWAYAAEGGTTGGEPIGWFLNESGSRTHRVATFPPNAWLLYDTLGNAWEWCLDWYDPAYYGGSPGTDPPGPSAGTRRVIRGGSWREYAGTVFTFTRNSLPPESRADNAGFRCVIDRPSSAF